MSADVDVLIVGAGHGGLGIASWLKRQGRDILLVDAHARIGETWRARWASLRLFTPRFANTLPGMPFPRGADPFPGKDEVADYQERFASELAVPMRLGARATRVAPSRDGFDVTVVTDHAGTAGAPGPETIHARRVVIATGAHHTPNLPLFASRLGPAVRQLHSREYGRAGALPSGPVLIVGARNSGVEIAMDLAATHEVTIAHGNRRTRYAPARWRSPRWWRVAQFRAWLLRGAFPPGPWPWPIKPPRGNWIELDLPRAEREGMLRVVPSAVDASEGVVRVADGREIRPRTVIWATGFRIDDSWIDVPQRDGAIAARPHHRGPVPGLWVNRANLLVSLRWGAIDVARDVAPDR
jgi:putative flavoprotein involved in K+ transport